MTLERLGLALLRHLEDAGGGGAGLVTRYDRIARSEKALEMFNLTLARLGTRLEVVSAVLA